MNKQNKKLKKQLKKIAKNKNKGDFTQPEFSNSSPMRGKAYLKKGSVYGW